MKKNLFLLLGIIMLNFSLLAQNLSPEMIEKIKQSVVRDQHFKASMNALSNNDVNKLALNRETTGKTDHFFKYKVDVKGISDQKSSGRCWMFTSMNVFRPKVMKTYQLSSFEFSHNYLYFWDMFEKANLFLEAALKYAEKPMDARENDWLYKEGIGDGGVWSSFTNLVEKYGLVPKDVMPETNSSNNTSRMNRHLNTKLREFGLEIRSMYTQKADRKKLDNRKIEMMAELYRMLALNLGEPPTEFTWRYLDKDNKLSPFKTYTPLSFMKEALADVVFTDYIMLMNDPTREYFKLYEIEFDRNVMEGRNWIYINVPSDTLKKIALESIKANEALYGSCDVGKFLNSDEGFSSVDNYNYEALYGVKFGMDKKNRILTKESGSSHGMAMVAADVDDKEKTTKWQFENSWGASSGHNGYLTYTDQWFDEYMFRVVALKKFVSPSLLKILEQKPILLPPWDPMFKMDE